MTDESSISTQSPVNGSNPPAKKKRNLPGTPDPEAEVVALSPKTLMARNRYLCEICGKGFQRDQNLQLHRRGHNLPWKLKQRSSTETRKRVYVCPEKSCVHHNPMRALGDLTGIKKHFCRKHGDKKWKCDKCSKRYAVQSDWKAHAKTCGTREYKCDCGAVFSRRDSFVTHRAFCDALAQETARMASSSNHNYNFMDQHFTSLFRPPTLPHPPPSPPTFWNLPPYHNLNWDNEVSLPSFFTTCQIQTQAHHGDSPRMSATALLQKAAQMGATTSDPSILLGNLGLKWSDDNNNSIQDGSNKLCGLYSTSSFGSDIESSVNDHCAINRLHVFSSSKRRRLESEENVEGETRDFLGVGISAMCPSSINGWI